VVEEEKEEKEDEWCFCSTSTLFSSTTPFSFFLPLLSPFSN
jgi:hypothetical protein